METKDVYNHGKKELKTPLAILNMQMHRRNVFFYERLDLIFSSLRTFFFKTLIPVILFPETLLAAPYYFRKKSPRNLKLKGFYSSGILS